MFICFSCDFLESKLLDFGRYGQQSRVGRQGQLWCISDQRQRQILECQFLSPQWDQSRWAGHEAEETVETKLKPVKRNDGTIKKIRIIFIKILRRWSLNDCHLRLDRWRAARVEPKEEGLHETVQRAEQSRFHASVKGVNCTTITTTIGVDLTNLVLVLIWPRIRVVGNNPGLKEYWDRD